MEPVKVYDVREDIKKYIDKCNILGVAPLRFTVKFDDVIAYGNDKTVKNIVVPRFVTKIGEGAFNEFEYLESIQLPEGIKSIGNRAFMYCKALNNINIPKSVVELGKNCFKECVNLERIELPDSIKTMPIWLFSGCRKLKYVNIPKEVVHIDDGAFKKTAIERLELPDNTIRIGIMAFYECKNLKEVILNKNLKDIEIEAFKGCNSLEIIQGYRNEIRANKLSFDKGVKISYA